MKVDDAAYSRIQIAKITINLYIAKRCDNTAALKDHIVAALQNYVTRRTYQFHTTVDGYIVI